MSIALGRIRGSPAGFAGICGPTYEPLAITAAKLEEEQRRESSSPAGSSLSSSSSIGTNSGVSDGIAGSEGSVEGEEDEVQSECRGSLTAMDSLLESLPIRQGISSFYNGKSKSFTSLMDAVCSSSSAKDLGKPENAFTRKRKNLLAHKSIWEKPCNNETKSIGSGTSKRAANSARHTSTKHENSRNGSGGERDKVQELPPLPKSGRPKDKCALQPNRPFQMRPSQPLLFRWIGLHYIATSISS